MCFKHEYIYLLQEREFIKTNEQVYKIGKTKQDNTKRFTQYPKSSIIILHLNVIDCDKLETILLDVFKTKFNQRMDIGQEYFEGDYRLMKSIIFNYCFVYDEENK